MLISDIATPRLWSDLQHVEAVWSKLPALLHSPAVMTAGGQNAATIMLINWPGNSTMCNQVTSSVAVQAHLSLMASTQP